MINQFIGLQDKFRIRIEETVKVKKVYAKGIAKPKKKPMGPNAEVEVVNGVVEESNTKREFVTEDEQSDGAP